ncbi:MAG TPA: carboxypeptidase-like regulatory domain-containing protein [Pyrinomonadaceae bacterium]|nr:carboxypeptidase-like regulatory domain-containing protein [Pyrinomonadaceae bacterium]
MSFSTRYLPAFLLTILSLPTSLWAQAAPKQATKAPRGSISGRVTIKEKSAEGVVVSLRKNDFTNPYEIAQRATTDQDGLYRIANVPPGTYEVTPSAPAFVPSDSKEPRNKTVLVGEDENVDNINFALVRGGVITGKVTDAEGRAVIQQQVNIYRVEIFEQQQGQPRQIYANAGGQTDDRGIYRVFGLLPGRYKVGVGRSDDTFTPSFSAQRSTYQQVFHPDVSDQAKATVIEVGEGTEAKDVDIALGRTLQTFIASGRVIDEKGLPVSNIRLGLNRSAGQRSEFVNTFPTTNNQGDFVIEGLLPGKYGIYLLPNQSGGMRLETLTFDIIDQDLSGLTVKLVPGASVSGIVVVEGENKAGITKIPELQLRAYVSNPGAGTGGGLGSSAASPISPDGSFQITGLPAGMVNFMLAGRTSPFPVKGFIIARIEREGVPLQRSIEIKDGEQVSGIRVVLAYGSGKLRGVLNLDSGVLPNGARYFVRLTKSGQIVSNVRPPEADSRGHFLIEDLPAGVYEIQAGVIGLPQLPTTVKREFSVQDGVTTDITITIEMPRTQKP